MIMGNETRVLVYYLELIFRRNRMKNICDNPNCECENCTCENCTCENCECK